MKALKLHYRQGQRLETTIKTPENGDYTVHAGRFYPILIVTDFGHAIPFMNFTEVWNRFGMGFKGIKFIGFDPLGLLIDSIRRV